MGFFPSVNRNHPDCARGHSVRSLGMTATGISERIRQRMIELGLNQKQLAVESGLNETAVRDILKGRSRSPRLETIEALAKTLGFPNAAELISPAAGFDESIMLDAIQAALEFVREAKPDWSDREIARAAVGLYRLYADPKRKRDPDSMRDALAFLMTTSAIDLDR